MAVEAKITRYSWPSPADCLLSAAAVAASPFLPIGQLPPENVVHTYEAIHGPVPQVSIPEAGILAGADPGNVWQLFRDSFGFEVYHSGVEFGWPEWRIAQLLYYGIPVILSIAKTWDWDGVPTSFHALCLTGYDDLYWHVYDQAAGQPWRQDLKWTADDFWAVEVYQQGERVMRQTWTGFAICLFPRDYGWGDPATW